MPIANVEFSDGTWLEGEEFCYPSGGMKRRAMKRQSFLYLNGRKPW